MAMDRSPSGGLSPGGSGDARKVKVGGGAQAQYCDNKITTSKYTPLTFLPKNLFEQLHKMGNVYFLLISILMYTGEHTALFIGTIKAFSTMGTLIMMMSVSAVVALLDDNKRKAADREANAQAAKYVPAGAGEPSRGSKAWEEVAVGEVLVVHEGDELPADMVVLYASGEDGAAYVSTANLDGETNLKLKGAAPIAQQVLSGGVAGKQAEQAVLARLKALSHCTVEAEAPKTSIHVFEGTLALAAKSDALSAANIMLRGTVLRNTAFAVGVVVYTGKETRMVMNSREAPSKMSNLERRTNQVMIIILLAQGLVALFSDLLYLTQKDDYEHLWYLPHPTLLLPNFISYWLTFFVLYSNMMPISLYPTMEFCNSFQTYFIRNDRMMYYKEMDFPAGVRSSNLCQELGQVAYIFSDKTGTLTQNVMELKRVWVGGRIFGDMTTTRGFSGGRDVAAARAADAGLAAKIDGFLEVLSVSHTCMASEHPDGGGKFKYDAESPDESALVETAAELGWTFAHRQGPTALVHRTAGGQGLQKHTYEVVATNAFNSTRKRMSVLVKLGTEYRLLVKGADNVMLERAEKKTDVVGLEGVLQNFAVQGLRTLVIGRRTLQPPEAQRWLAVHDAAQRTLADREGALMRAAEEIEKDIEIVGVTAIEDKLQDHVPETIEHLRQAGIRVWVLTGDKLETARNIGFSSKVLVDGMTIATLDAEGGNMSERLDTEVRRLQGPHEEPLKRDQKAVMVTGAALEQILADDRLKTTFLGMAQECAVVIGCRVSPLQKAQMVQLVREGVVPTPVTLGIGDGANDVPMIQEAQVGVGIAGREGRQAVNNSDFAIGQFSYLQRLLLVHGRWNYRRACKFTVFTFWRNAVQVLCIFYYTLVSGFSGTSIFEDWVRLSFNFLCSFPIMATGCFDQDIPAHVALENPRQYVWGREGRDLNGGQMVAALASAVLHSIIISTMCWLAYPSFDVLGTGDYYTFGTAMYCILVLMMNYRVLFLNYTHNKYTLGAIGLSFLGLASWLAVYTCVKPVTYLFVSNMYFTAYHMVRSLPFWLLVLAVPIVGLNFDLCLGQVWRMSSREDREVHKLREKQRPSDDDRSPLLERDSEMARGGFAPRGFEGRDVGGLDMSELAQQTSAGLPLNLSHPVSRALACAGGLLLIALGLGVKGTCQDVRQLRVQYEGHRGDADPWGTWPREVVYLDHCNQGDTCTVSLKVNQTLRPPVLVQYHVGPFYQNANTYIKSEVPEEVRGSLAASKRDTLCGAGEAAKDESGNDIFPCGMKVMSMFDDVIDVQGADVRRTGIAWDSDVSRFANPPDYLKRPHTTWLADLYPDLISKEAGATSEDFIVWMRPSAGTYVTKRWGWIDQEVKEGDVLNIAIKNRFDVASFKGYKQLVLTELSAYGGRDIGLAMALVVGGGLCVALAVVTAALRHLETVWHQHERA